MAPFRRSRCSGSRACKAQQQTCQPCASRTQPGSCHCAAPPASPCTPVGVAAVAPIPMAQPAGVPLAPASPVQPAAIAAAATPNGQEPVPGSPAALALLAEVGIAPRAAAGRAVGADDLRFSPVTIGHLTHRLVEVKQLLDQLTAEQKELHETLRLAHLRGDLLHLVPPGQEPGTYQLPEGPTLHRRQGRKQWHYSEVTAELEAQLKARQVYEQAAGLATTSIGASFWELRFPKG